jgi:sirohydrochlorin ferrochelatase
MKERPMKAILYVVHGSQISKKNRQLAHLLENVAEKTQDMASLQAIAYLERQADTIEVVAERLIASGGDDLLVLPILLFPALHTLVDIPTELAFIAEKYPHVTVKVLKNFGDEPAIFEILIDKVRQITSEQVILLAHGTRHFSEPAQMLANIAEKLMAKTQQTVCAVDYLGKKTYHEVISQNLANGVTQTVLPFFLYDGDLLKKRVKKSVWEINPTIPFTTPLDFDPRMVLALTDIIRKEKQFDTDFIRLTS